jgi:hypothetical protein
VLERPAMKRTVRLGFGRYPRQLLPTSSCCGLCGSSKGTSAMESVLARACYTNGEMRLTPRFQRFEQLSHDSQIRVLAKLLRPFLDEAQRSFLDLWIGGL